MRRWIPFLIVLVAVISSAAVYADLPARMPTHWNLSGEPDGWSGRYWGAWLMPLLLAVALVIFRLLPLIDPRRANYEKFRNAYDLLIIAVMLFMLGVHLVMLAVALGHPVSMMQVMPIGIGAFFVVIGYILPRARSNWFVGVRTPWTLTSELSWERTHRVGGYMFVAGGLLTIVSGFFAPRAAIWVLGATGVAIAVILLPYSYIVWKGDPARSRSGSG